MFRKIYWKYSKKVFILCFIITIVLPILAMFWIVAKFDLPFLNSGDKLPALIVLILWWLSTSIFIFGWDIKI